MSETIAESNARGARAVELILPEKLRDVLRCKTCGHFLERAERYWVCPIGFHSKAVPDGVICIRLWDAKKRHTGVVELRSVQVLELLKRLCGAFGRRPNFREYTGG
jgi:hypothetical protein